MSAIAYPYLRLADSGLSPWLVSRDGEAAVPLAEVVEAWDYGVDLVLERTLSLDVPGALASLGLSEGAIGLVVTAGTGGPRGERVRRIVWRDQVVGSEAREIAVSLAGADLSQVLTLTTEIVLLHGEGGGPLSPCAAQARLWRDSVRVVLEPDVRRFPIEAASFRELLRDQPSEALWHLDWSVTDLDRDFTGAVRLYLNSDHPDFLVRVGMADETVVQLLMGGVINQLARGALETETFSLAMAAEQPESLGGAVAGWLQQAFPNVALETLRTLARSRPAQFETAVLSVAAGDPSDA